jgi:hypothetical protein
MQNVGDVHDTPDSMLTGCPPVSDQVVPFHVSDSPVANSPE